MLALHNSYMSIGEKIRKRRRALEISQGALLKRLGEEFGISMHQPTLSRIEADARGEGKGSLWAKEIEAFSRILRLKVDYLLDDSRGWPPANGDCLPETPPEIPGKIPLKQAVGVGEGETIAVFYVSAGETDIAYTDAGYPAGQGIEEMPRPPGCSDPNAYGVIVKGNSMTPALPEGTSLVAEPGTKAQVGDVVVCREKQGDKVYIKELKRLDDGVILESYNRQEHDPLFFKIEDIYFIHPCFHIVRPRRGI